MSALVAPDDWLAPCHAFRTVTLACSWVDFGTLSFGSVPEPHKRRKKGTSHRQASQPWMPLPAVVALTGRERESSPQARVLNSAKDKIPQKGYEPSLYSALGLSFSSLSGRCLPSIVVPSLHLHCRSFLGWRCLSISSFLSEFWNYSQSFTGKDGPQVPASKGPHIDDPLFGFGTAKGCFSSRPPDDPCLPGHPPQAVPVSPNIKRSEMACLCRSR
jgi:hypothetical protein